MLLLILSYLIIRWLSFNVPAVQQSWQSLVIYRGLSVPLLAMVLGGTLPLFLNLFWQEDLQNLKSPFDHEIYTVFNRPTLRERRPWGNTRG